MPTKYGHLLLPDFLFFDGIAGQTSQSCLKNGVCLQDGEERAQQEENAKGIEMEGDFEGQMEDLPLNEDSGSEEAGDEERLEQEMGEVGDAGDTVDERLWNEEDKPEETQQGPPKKEKNSTVQVRYHTQQCQLLCVM